MDTSTDFYSFTRAVIAFTDTSKEVVRSYSTDFTSYYKNCTDKENRNDSRRTHT